MKRLLTLFGLTVFIISCGGESSTGSGNSDKEEGSSPKGEVSVEPLRTNCGLDVESLKDHIDLDMDISQLCLGDVRILRNAFAARQGYCFMKADLRAVFGTTSWYDKAMDERWWAEDGGEPVEPIAYNKEEQAFIDKLKAREKELLAQNYVDSSGRKMANMINVVNLFQLENEEPELMGMLAKNGFAIVPNDNIQLFHVYEENDYDQFPNFVTTDMYMQLFHMYFGYMLRTVEQEKFIPILQQLCLDMKADMDDIAQTSPDGPIKELARFNSTFYAIAYTSLTGKKVEVPEGYETHYNTELKNINAATDEFSVFMEFTDVYFPYSLFKPRGHYTRNDELKRYFKAMMWLQTAPFCADNERHLKLLALNASVLVNSPNHGMENFEKYKSLMDPITFIIGEPDNVSFLDVADLMSKVKYDLNSVLTQPSLLADFKKRVRELAKQKNTIKPKQALSCVDRVNFMPQRYLADNEVMQELVDVESNPTKRGYPMGLDVMAAFGSSPAERILLDELNEGERWDTYPGLLDKQKQNMKDVNWNATVYNKWIHSLMELQKPNKDYPYFMQTPQWDKKNLNASLASWAELKHDAILYGEQPMAAECGGGGPPEPVTVGYVEPNVNYWQDVIELIDQTRKVFDQHGLMTSGMDASTKKLKENAEFLLSASKKELKGEKLTDREYSEIEYIGSTFEWITLDLVKDEDQYFSSWDDVKGPDKSVAVVADVYTANGMNNPMKGILHVATGNVNDIFVVVEIEGYLYLTKGAVFSYHEFPQPLGTRLTDEEWQKMLKEGKAPDVPSWMKEIILQIDSPKSNEKVFYSSGC